MFSNVFLFIYYFLYIYIYIYINTGSYDVITSSGGMGEGHIPVEGIDDMYRLAKVG